MQLNTAGHRRSSLPVNHNLQALRAAAAYGVVIYHIVDSYNNYIGIGRVPIEFKVGATGVELFFVISGYIMCATTDVSGVTPRQFIFNRIVRIVPSYWLLTLAASFIVYSGFHLFGNLEIEPSHLVQSLLFIPTFNATGPNVPPVLFVGWTLNYEMLFYALFFVTLYLKSNWLRKLAITAILIALVGAGKFSANEYIRFWGSEIVLAFLFGIVIRVVQERITVPTGAAITLLALSTTGLLQIDLMPNFKNLSFHHMIIIVSAAFLVFSVMSIEWSGNSVGDGFLSKQGDASYAIYLLHPFVIAAIGKLSIVTGLNLSIPGLFVTAIAMFVLSGYGGTLFHRWVEMRLVRYLKRIRAAGKKMDGGKKSDKDRFYSSGPISACSSESNRSTPGM